MGPGKLSIALVSDYFFPNRGGVETHIRTIGEELCRLGHTVIVITHRYSGYKDLLKLGPLSVYYLDIPVLTMNTTVPTLFTNYVVFKTIFTKHSINIVHGHQSLSNLCMEGLYHASNLNIRTVLTDHSVFEIAKFERIIVNGLSSFICKNVDFAICVSQISKENTHLRTQIPLDRITVIPNGIIPEKFYPKKKRYAHGDKIKLLIMSRLTFRKGIDLLIDALPSICRNKDISVIIVGDGPKRCEIEQKIDDNDLQEQVTMVGEVNHEDVGTILRECDIFLNTSLTETFCLAILEAASCGLRIVSTNVGGIHEVLPIEDIYFCKPTAEDICEQVFNATRNLETHDPSRIFNMIHLRYDWKTITKQTEDVYRSLPRKNISFESVMAQFPRNRHFLCRFATCIEYLQIKFFSLFE